MQKIHIHSNAIALILTRVEAKALKSRLELHVGIKKTKVLEKVKTKLAVAMGEI